MDELFIVSLLVSLLALIVGLLALQVTRDLRRKTTEHIFTIAKVSSGETQSAEHPQGYYRFALYIKNLGLPFPEMSITLRFREKSGMGWLSMPLRTISIRDDTSADSAVNVAAGLVVKFGWRSYEMSDGDVRSLQCLEDIRNQRAVFSVYCAGYLVKDIRIETRKDRRVQRWRNMVYSMGSRLGLGETAKNQKSWKARMRLPDCVMMSSALVFFIANLSRRDSL